MKRYQVYINFMSDRDQQKLERYLIAALQKTGASINHMTMKEVSLGRPGVNGPKVMEYIEGLDKDVIFSVQDVQDATGLSDPAVRKQLRKMVNQRVIQKQFEPGQEARYRWCGTEE